MFIDSDDAITETALEELYSSAKNFNVDVVHCEKYYRAPSDTVTTDKKLLKEQPYEKGQQVTEPTFVTNDLAERVKAFGEYKFAGYSCNNLIRRDFIAQNGIKFPDLRAGEDHIFAFFILCLAESIIRVPNVYYIYRNNPNSLTWANLPKDEIVHRWTDSLFRGTKLIDEFINKFEVLRNHPEYKYAVLDTIMAAHAIHVLALYQTIPAYQLDSLIRRELEQVEDTTALTAFLFGRMNVFNVNLIKQQQLIIQQQRQIQQLQNQLQQVKSSSNMFNFNSVDFFKI